MYAEGTTAAAGGPTWEGLALSRAKVIAGKLSEQSKGRGPAEQ